MKRLRVATTEEIDSIRLTSDLDPTCIVLALDTPNGTVLSVVRTALEVDPVYFPEGFPDRFKLFFMRDIETFLSAKGALSYYFNVKAEDEQWQSVIKNFGAEQVSPQAEIRFKKML